MRIIYCYFNIKFKYSHKFYKKIKYNKVNLLYK